MRSLGYFIKNPSDFIIAYLKRYGWWLPDSIYLKLRYRNEMGTSLNLKNPQSFTEKIQWLKIHRRKDEFTRMVDKLAVKRYVADLIGEEFIIPTLGVWDNFNEIDFSSLPNSFVLKTTHGGGSTGVVVVPNRDKMDKNKAKKMLEWSMKCDVYTATREWPYKNVPRKIIAEQFLSDGNKKDLSDYKWFCFNGEPMYCQVIRDRNSLETIDFYDKDWNHQDFVGLNPTAKNGIYPVKKPCNLNKMIEIARLLSKGLEFIRVDLYEVNGRLYFGELTFFPASGIGKFTPSKWNDELGKLIKLKN